MGSFQLSKSEVYGIGIKRLDHVQLCVPKGQEEKARNFYCGILGLVEIEKPASLVPNGGFWLQAGDVQIHIGTEPMGTEQSKRHPAFEVVNVGEARAHLLKHGVKLKEEIPFPGVERFSFFDPFGNRVELLEKTEVTRIPSEGRKGEVQAQFGPRLLRK